MAQEAFEKTKKEMDLATEMRVARLIMNDAQQLEERAAVEGVTAFLRRPVHRAPPNERFLQNTLRSVEFANQQSEVNEMWKTRQKQLEREKRESRKNSKRDESRRGRPFDNEDGGNRRKFQRKWERASTSENQATLGSDAGEERRKESAQEREDRGERVESTERRKNFSKRERETECGDRFCEEDRGGQDSEKRVRGDVGKDELDHTSCSSGDDEDRLRTFLTSKHVRGRGGVGSRQGNDSGGHFVEGTISGENSQQRYPYVFSDDGEFLPTSIPRMENKKSSQISKKKKKKKSKKAKKEKEAGKKKPKREKKGKKEG
ncbi:hypothetical protein BSKO_06142 [Bryopsis sp. KO-2023]|nr:hypothetical protein BSKO_06142 [Bryopsis sp. KO-2023]